jgi:hypothetical protein
MYDFWFTLGSAIMRPELLKVISTGAYFERLKKRDIVETNQAGTKKTYPNTTTPGLLRNKETTDVRNNIRQYYLRNTPGAPPVSIFTAGRFSQLLLVPEIGFEASVNLAHQAYHDALQGTPERFSNGFVAFLGLCLVDSKVTIWFQTPTDPGLLDALSEFGIDPDFTKPELQVLTRYIAAKNFTTAQGNLLNGFGWPSGCVEQFLFWEGKNEHAILT